MDITALDVAQFGRMWFAHRASEAPPETRWLVEDGAGARAGVMWEEHRPARRVDVVFLDEAPDPAGLLLEVTTNTPDAKQTNRPTWWTRRWEPFPGRGARGTDSRTIVYETAPSILSAGLRHYPPEFQYEPDPDGLILIDRIRLRCLKPDPPPVVTSIHVFGCSMLAPMRVEIEWGFDDRRTKRRRDGQSASEDIEIEIFNGRLGAVTSLMDGGLVGNTGLSHYRLSSPPEGRRGVIVEVGYVADDAQTVRFRPNLNLPVGNEGSLSYHPNHTVVTVRTGGGRVSFAPKDLEADEPILATAAGFFISRAGSGETAVAFVRRRPGDAVSVRERVRRLPEQSIGRALTDHYGAGRPAMPETQDGPPMRIDVPDELAMRAWRLAFHHVRRRCLPENGVVLLHIWPYPSLLGQESWRIAASLDLLGEHEIPRAGFEPWFANQGQYVAGGRFSDTDGALHVPGWDLNHAQGHGSMLYAMAMHALLTGDEEWLRDHRASLEVACEWIARQRREWTKEAGPGSASAGLMPPCEMGDYADWRSLYQTNVFFWRGLRTAAEALSEIAPKSAIRFLDEAEEFRQSIQRAARFSADAAPVLRAADGAYRRFFPPHPYLRGSCAEFANPYSGGHAGTLVMDSDCGAAALGLGVLPPDDPDFDEFIDVLEDRLYLDNWVTRMHAVERMGNRPDAWFSAGGYYYQCGYSQSALVHLMRDDVPNFLRSMWNQYAADVDPENGYQFREHPNRAGEGNGGDKTFETAAFLERMRAMLVMEDGDRLWLARGTPRDWLSEGRKIAVADAPTVFGPVGYEIRSGVGQGRIDARVTLPSRREPNEVRLRLRHPEKARIRSVIVNGREWTEYDPERECIILTGMSGTADIAAYYGPPAR